MALTARARDVVASPSGFRTTSIARLVLWAGLAVGLGLRWWWVLRADFPLNDGGLFHQMVRDLQADGYALPNHTTYNLGDIPFAYPPLGLYLAALLDDLTPLSLTAVLRVVPAVFASVQLVVMVRIARLVVRSEAAVAGAVWAFAVLAPGIGYQVMGGGITRAPGVAAAMVALWLLLESRHEERAGRRHVVGAGVAAACAVLTHPEAALFVAVSAPVLTLVGPGPRLPLRRLAVAVGVAGVVCAPWALVVLSRHGVGTYLGAASGGNRLLVLTLLVPSTVTAEVVPVVGVAALVGVVLAWRNGDPRLAVWTVVLFLVNPRSADQRVAMPLALAAGVTVAWLVAGPRARGVRREVLVGIGVAASLVCLANAVRIGPTLQPVSADQREAMAWVAHHTTDDAVFVVAEDGPWYRARAGEWFPVLTGRRAITTVQGREFTDTDGSFTDLLRWRDETMACAFDGPECLAGAAQLSVTHVYVAKVAPDGRRHTGEDLAALLVTDERFDLLYDSADAAVFRLR